MPVATEHAAGFSQKSVEENWFSTWEEIKLESYCFQKYSRWIKALNI